MMRGNANVGPVIEYLKNILFIFSVFEVRMVTLEKHPQFSCAPDKIALIKVGSGCTEFLGGRDLQTSDLNGRWHLWRSEEKFLL